MFYVAVFIELNLHNTRDKIVEEDGKDRHNHYVPAEVEIHLSSFHVVVSRHDSARKMLS